MERWIAWLQEIGKNDRELTGAKFANLGELSSIGIPVPLGFAVTAQAYNFFLKKTGAFREIKEFIGTLKHRPETLREYEEMSQKIYAIIMGKEVPLELAEIISEAYGQLSKKTSINDVAVAVRSSGIDEDLPQAAFAGQYETYLNIRGRENVLAKVKECFASLFSARGIAYRMKNNMPILTGSIAVIVQRMIKARCGGVAFTMLPGQGDRSRIMIEANWGIAETVVQGSVAPDTYVIKKDGLALEERRISRKLKRVVFGEMGTKEEDIPPEKQAAPCLSDNEAVRIGEYALRVESHYGSPQDVEWAVEEGKTFPNNIFLVQARPLTAVGESSPVDRVAELMCSRFLGLN